MTDEDKRRDEVLRQMLGNPPTLHKVKPKKRDAGRKKKAQPD